MTAPAHLPTINAHWTRHQLEHNLSRVLSPTVCHEVLRMLRQPEADFGDVAAVLQGDPYIAAKVVALADLARRHGEEPITSLQRAVQLLGLRHVQRLVLAVMLTGPLMAADNAVVRRRDLWRWTFGCAAAGDHFTRCLAGETDDDDDDPGLGAGAALVVGRFDITGLLLALGPLVLFAGLGRHYGKVLGSRMAPMRLARREQQTLGVTHHQVTLWALEAMRCPAYLGRYPLALADEEDGPLALRARAIEVLAARLAGLESAAADAWLADALPRLGLDADRLISDVVPRLRQRVTDLARVYDLDLGDGADQEQARQDAIYAAGTALDALLVDHVNVTTIATARG